MSKLSLFSTGFVCVLFASKILLEFVFGWSNGFRPEGLNKAPNEERLTDGLIGIVGAKGFVRFTFCLLPKRDGREEVLVFARPKLNG